MSVNMVNFGNPLSIYIPDKMIINRNDSNQITSVDFTLPDSDGRQFSYSDVAGKNLDTLENQGYFNGISGTAKAIINKFQQTYQDKPLILMDALGMLKPPTAAEAQTPDAAYVKQADDAWAAKWNPPQYSAQELAFWNYVNDHRATTDDNSSSERVSANFIPPKPAFNTPPSDAGTNSTNTSSNINSSVNQTSTLSSADYTSKLATLAYKNADQYNSQALSTIMDMV